MPAVSAAKTTAIMPRLDWRKARTLLTTRSYTLPLTVRLAASPPAPPRLGFRHGQSDPCNRDHGASLDARLGQSRSQGAEGAHREGLHPADGFQAPGDPRSAELARCGGGPLGLLVLP